MSGTTCPYSFNPLPAMNPPQKKSSLADLSGRPLDTPEAPAPVIAPLRMGCVGPECVLFEELPDGLFCWELRAKKATVELMSYLREHPPTTHIAIREPRK